MAVLCANCVVCLCACTCCIVGSCAVHCVYVPTEVDGVPRRSRGVRSWVLSLLAILHYASIGPFKRNSTCCTLLYVLLFS